MTLEGKAALVTGASRGKGDQTDKRHAVRVVADRKGERAVERDASSAQDDVPRGGAPLAGD